MMAVPVTGNGKEFAYGRPVQVFSTAPYYTGRSPGRAD